MEQSNNQTTAPEVTQTTSDASATQADSSPQKTNENPSENVSSTHANENLRNKLRAERKALEMKQALSVERQKWETERESEKKSLAEQKQKLSKWERWEAEREKGNHRPYLDDNEIILQDLYKSYLSDDTSNKEKEQLKELMKPYQEEVAMLKKIEEQRQQEKTAAFEAEEAHAANLLQAEIKLRIERSIGSDAEEGTVEETKYELLQNYPDKEQLVLKLLVLDDKGPRQFKTYEDAIMAAENLLYETEIVGNPLLKTKKASSWSNSPILIDKSPLSNGASEDNSEDFLSVNSLEDAEEAKNRKTSAAKQKVLKHRRSVEAAPVDPIKARKQAFEQRKQSLAEAARKQRR